jgi:hypothetical protein
MRPLLALILAATVLVAKPARKGDPMAPETWATSPSTHQGKPVRTAALRIEDPGLVAGDAPAAVLRMEGGNEQGESGGAILVLLPPAQLTSFTETYSRMEPGKGRGGFGVVAKPRVVSGTFALVGGEPALLVGIPPAEASRLPKPSALLREQLARAREALLKPSREGWQRKAFILSRLDQRGHPETTRELQRLCDLANAADRTARLTPREAVRRAREGEQLVVADERARTEWLLLPE